MARTIMSALIALAAASAVVGGDWALTAERIHQAIADEKAETCYELKEKMSAWKWGGPIGGCFTTPYSRVAAAAQAAKRTYKTFTESDVTPELVRPEIDVIAFPEAKESVDAIVVAPRNSKDRAAVIQPIGTVQTSTEFQNLYGARFEGVGLTATFPLSVLADDNEVRIVTSTGERKAPFKLDKVK